MRILALLVLVSCGSPRRGPPLEPPVPLGVREELGRAVFQRECAPCHPGGAGGLGPAINDKPLPAFFIARQIRNGWGAMPAFPEERISDRELDDLLAYLDALQERG